MGVDSSRSAVRKIEKEQGSLLRKKKKEKKGRRRRCLSVFFFFQRNVKITILPLNLSKRVNKGSNDRIAPVSPGFLMEVTMQACKNATSVK